ncbi:hypothetical protein MSG28_005485 [Choristoneura fumiferana]|uniref:Uncharacterized protein n=1 Tax=Choristoneura fumiferana TaxID=7141 RepID=A0ACC0KZ24_CHOFU|nr:hypothetical protein MSG28_005485 [Choristoneura fumiferana]
MYYILEANLVLAQDRGGGPGFGGGYGRWGGGYGGIGVIGFGRRFGYGYGGGYYPPPPPPLFYPPPPFFG